MKRVLVSLTMVILVAGPGFPDDGSSPQAVRDLGRFRQEYADVIALQGTARQEILAIARLLRAKPEMAIDQTEASGEYCFKSGLGTMVHYASDPITTREDIVYEFDAAGLINAGLDPRRLPALPPLGKMEPGQWYHLPEGSVDPHHKHTMPGMTLLIAVDVR